jgi:hypothetical protein
MFTFEAHVENEFKNIKKLLLSNNQKLESIMASLKKLEDAVAKEISIDESAITLIKGLSQQIKDAGADEAKLNALTDKLDANADALAAAVAANTPASPAPEPTPSPEPTPDVPTPSEPTEPDSTAPEEPGQPA